MENFMMVTKNKLGNPKQDIEILDFIKRKNKKENKKHNK